MSHRIGIAVITLSIVMSIPAGSAAWHTEGVSPGAVDRIAEIESRCPTFIWAGEPGAMAFEVVVYQLPEVPLSAASAIRGTIPDVSGETYGVPLISGIHVMV